MGNRSTDQRLVGQRAAPRCRGGRPRRPRQRVDRGPPRGPPDQPRIPRRIQRSDGDTRLLDRSAKTVEIGHDRPRQARRARPARQPAEQRRPAAELDAQVHHDALALGVDGWVRDLCERLAEMIGHGTVEPATPGGRGVVTHAPERLVALEGHGLDVQPSALGIQTGQVAQRVVGGGALAMSALAVGGRLGRMGFPAILVDRPGRVVDRQRTEDPRLRLGVFEDRAASRLDQEELTWPEAPAPDRLGRRERHRSGFRGDRDESVSRDGEGSGSESVSIDEGANAPAVRERESSRAIPRGKEPGRAAAERRHMRVRAAAEGERLGNRRQEGRRQVPAGRDEQFEGLIERQRIGAVG